MLAAALGLGGCAGTERVATTAKPLEQLKPAPAYKIGNPYQVDGVWYYPSEDFNYSETGIASWYGDEFAGPIDRERRNLRSKPDHGRPSYAAHAQHRPHHQSR
jgi:hypothetical protein